MDRAENVISLDKGFHVAHLNVGSMFGGGKMDMLKKQIEFSGVEIFTLSETWLTQSIPDALVSIQTYNVVRLDRSWSDKNNPFNIKKGGGLACYLREGINYSDTKLSNLNCSCADLEMQWISVNIKNVRPLVIVNAYRPPSGDYKKACTLISEAFLRADLKDNTEYYMLGDFNIDFDDKKSPAFKELDFTSRSLGLIQLIPVPTRFYLSNGVIKHSRLDLVFSNSETIQSAKTLDINVSDHLAVMVTRKKTRVKVPKVSFVGRSYKNYVKEDFQESLSSANWREFYRTTDPNKQWEIMEDVILDNIEVMCPLKSFNVRGYREPWITNEAIEAIKDKDRLLAKARRSDKVEDWTRAKRVRNEVGRDLRNLRADYLKQQQEANKSDPKKFWKTVASIITTKNSKTGNIWLREGGNGRNVDQEETAGHFNSYFTNVGPNLAQAHNKHWMYYGEEVVNKMGTPFADTDKVIKLCREINVMKASGLEKLSSRICKDAFLVLSDQLTHMFNCSLETAIFPDAWKLATVIPLFKGGNREDVNNYRPVSLLPLPGKLLEKIVHENVTSFLETNDFLCHSQGGFRKGFSTVSTIADITDDIFLATNTGNVTLATFIDLRKAFDTVDICILLRKLKFAGIQDSMLAWCKGYLTSRSQCVFANNAKSSFLPITCGVPQGSVLGPLFFLVYINDMINALNTDCKSKLYADDTVIYCSGIDPNAVACRLQSGLNLFTTWCSRNKLTINTKKTKLMVFGSRSRVKKAKNVSVVMDNDRLRPVPSFKYLGVLLDSTLTYNSHISSLIRTVIHKITLLSKVKKYMTNNVALQIYKSMILPYLDYADVVFDKAFTKDLDKLQRLQNRCLKICAGNDRLFGTELAHKNAGVPFLSDRRRAHTLNFMYKRKEKKDLLNRREIRTRAHDAPLFNVLIPRCEAYKRSVGYAGSTLWNDLPPAVRNTDCYIRFREIQKKNMLHPLSLIQS